MLERHIGVTPWSWRENIGHVSIRWGKDISSLLGRYIDSLMLTMECLIIICIMEISRNTATRDRPVEDIRGIDSLFPLGEFFFIDKVLANASTFDSLCICFFGFITIILGKKELKRLTIAITRLLPESLNLSLSCLLRCDILDIECLLSLGDLEELFSFAFLACERRTLILEP